jgi:AcrR family transcriptional regulator
MPTPPVKSLLSRRSPSQARSVVTVSAIFEASVQVLLREGLHRLTTTRVADRAGVSVGTLYQYYPNKLALLNAVLQRHLEVVAETVEKAAQKAHGKPLPIMVTAVVHAFVKAKIGKEDEARALYSVAEQLGGSILVQRASQRAVTALALMLSTASEVRFPDLEIVSYVFAAAMTGPTKGVLEKQAPRKLAQILKSQLISLCLGYLERQAESVPPALPSGAGAARKVRNAAGSHVS